MPGMLLHPWLHPSSHIPWILKPHMCHQQFYLYPQGPGHLPPWAQLWDAKKEGTLEELPTYTQRNLPLLSQRGANAPVRKW